MFFINSRCHQVFGKFRILLIFESHIADGQTLRESYIAIKQSVKIDSGAVCKFFAIEHAGTVKFDIRIFADCFSGLPFDFTVVFECKFRGFEEKFRIIFADEDLSGERSCTENIFTVPDGNVASVNSDRSPDCRNGIFSTVSVADKTQIGNGGGACDFACTFAVKEKFGNKLQFAVVGDIINFAAEIYGVRSKSF